jgi:hypothetical protein
MEPTWLGSVPFASTQNGAMPDWNRLVGEVRRLARQTGAPKHRHRLRSREGRASMACGSLAIDRRPRGRLQNVSTTRVECRALAGTLADDEKLVNSWNSNPYRQKSRAITKLERHGHRVRVPSTPPTFASPEPGLEQPGGGGLRLASQASALVTCEGCPRSRNAAKADDFSQAGDAISTSTGSSPVKQ